MAVMYFEDQSPYGSLGLVADGLTEGLIDRLLREIREAGYTGQVVSARDLDIY